MSWSLRFCPACGEKASPEKASGTVRCPNCGQTHFRNPAVGVAVIIRRGRDVLLGRRARGRRAGLWCIPCGYVEWGEDVREAARRELIEETGLVADIGSVFAVHSNFHDPERLTVGIWFHGMVSGGALRAADDLDAVDYFDPAAPPPLAFPTDAIVLRDLARNER